MQGVINGKRKTKNGARELKEIIAELKEWQKENPKERSVLLIAGLEEDNIMTTIGGPKQDIVENIASELVKNRVVTEAISQAIRIALEYANEKEEDN